ncbi:MULTISPECIES: hypothetical protein [unclassified Rhizobium]|uniref:hypothetical protein n=1 Tax=unclassified Rhizobium TaxID=2613769 RepID=UPI001AD9AC71|nr:MULTISPECIES: hypothetical protein [unclassified Rhizobium]MBO9125449.1 hypothetical protein [Rhizobium sp. 16-488-2b]MBO9176034.1 hypothetical protein [Rhizobium sp. 16-488-2a]
MQDTDQIAALFLFTVVGGAIGARIVKSEFWKGALTTAASLVIVGAIFMTAGSTNHILALAAVAVAMIATCGALRMKPIQITTTVLGAYAGLLAVQTFIFWTSQA